ncbi:MAG: hypothetical protein DWQ35_10810 [Planctomycetota bacterium]|nr:MAG: hypothetical protein DWQ35_10810 [Planctomycetota bacterium]REK23348.1 MAG: hypothetical protein DWQ42_15395 [Planctomycetota bacterium]REK47151.1 MAG: hypothetical protein DWQ46_04775 [Planctomycetota bacterium]
MQLRDVVRLNSLLLVAVLGWSGQATDLWAALPTDQLLPKTTKGVLLIADIERLETQFDQTQLGQLMADPVMQPFADDLRRQIRQKWSKANSRLGLTWDDMRTVPSGEIGIGVIQPAENEGVTFIIVDVTGKMDEAEALLAKVDENLKAKQATLETQQMLGQEMLIYTHVPRKGAKKDEPAEMAVFVLHREQQQLIAVDDVAQMENLLARYTQQTDDRLADLEAYRATMERCAAAAGSLEPEVRWFAEPFGFIEAMRARERGETKRKGVDMHAILQAEGFDAIQGVGGYVNFYDGTHDILHRTMVYAPAIERAADDPSTDKYNLAARMLNFINANNHGPPAWIPRELATFHSLNADLKNAFEYSSTLVNRIANDPIFEDVIESLINDPHGPQVDLRADLVAHLGEHVMVVTDYALPITPKSEQLLIMIELTDPEVVRNTVDKLMSADRQAQREVVVDGDNEYVLWYIPDEETQVTELDLDFDFDSIDIPEDNQTEKKEEARALPTQAMTVAFGHLFTGTHPELIRRMLKDVEARATLAGSVDYQMVRAALEQLGSASNSVQTFSRTDEEYRPTYELMRQGKMPESDTLLGKLLNQMLGDDEDDENLREQQIDGTKLPDFQIVRRYLGPAGFFVDSEESGWFVTGVFLSKVPPSAPKIVKRNER